MLWWCSHTHTHTHTIFARPPALKWYYFHYIIIGICAARGMCAQVADIKTRGVDVSWRVDAPLYSTLSHPSARTRIAIVFLSECVDIIKIYDVQGYVHIINSAATPLVVPTFCSPIPHTKQTRICRRFIAPRPDFLQDLFYKLHSYSYTHILYMCLGVRCETI